MSNVTDAVTAPGPDLPRRFAALRNRDSRPYLFAAGLSMMADNVEHVITYWVLWQKFHSPALVGFEVISHWLPYLLLSVWFGGLAQRFDCRRLIQIAQGLFMLVSVVWGILFATHSLQIWEACILLVLHGCAGALWGPAEQLMLHDFVERRELPSAVRLNATFRSLGILLGPVVGSALLLGLGSTLGIFANVLIYVPMTIVMARTKFTGHIRDASDVPARPRVGLLSSVRLLRELRSNRLLVSMIVLAGIVAVTIGGALQVSMPTFANELGAGTAGLAYGVLLLANGAGGVLGGFFLEATGLLKPSARAAIIATIAFGLTTLGFALTHNYIVAIVALVIGGVANIASASITQSIVQLEAPADDRGRVYGVYGVFASGFRTGNGLTLGILGAILGIPYSIALCAALLVVGAIVTAIYGRRPKRTIT
jgi:MFS family permease